MDKVIEDDAGNTLICNKIKMDLAQRRRLYKNNYEKDKRILKRGFAALSAHPARPRTILSKVVTRAIVILGANLNMAALEQLIATDNRFVDSRQMFVSRTPLENRNINNALSKRRVKLRYVLGLRG